MANEERKEIIAALTSLANEQRRMANMLERLTAEKPPWVKTAEKVLETAQTVIEDAPVVPKEPTDSEKQKPIPSKIENELIGKTVKVIGGDHKGKTGTITDKRRSWIYVSTEDDPQIAVRFMHLEVIGDETGAPSNEAEQTKVDELNTLISESEAEGTETTEAEIKAIGPEPSEQSEDPSNYVIEKGKHEGKTLHVLYHESSMGAKTVKWMAEKSNDEVQKENARAYLTSIGEA